LARHFKQPKTGNPAHLDPGPILLERITQPVFDLPLILGRRHIDEVDDDKAAHISQPELPSNLIRGF